MAQSIKQTRAGLLEYLEKNDARIRDMLPHLDQGRPARLLMDKFMPGMAQRVQNFGSALMDDQEKGIRSDAPIIDVPPTKSAGQEGESSWHSRMGNRFPPLKNR